MLACKTSRFATRNWLERRMQRTDVDVLYISALPVHTCWGHSNLPSYIFTHESLGGLFFHSTKRQLREWYHCSSCSNLKTADGGSATQIWSGSLPMCEKSSTNLINIKMKQITRHCLSKNPTLRSIKALCHQTDMQWCWHAAVCSTWIYEYLYKWEVLLALALFGREGIL